MTTKDQPKLTPEQDKRLRKARLEEAKAERRIKKLVARVWPPAGPPTLLDRLVVAANPIQAILRLVSWLAKQRILWWHIGLPALFGTAEVRAARMSCAASGLLGEASGTMDRRGRVLSRGLTRWWCDGCGWPDADALAKAKEDKRERERRDAEGRRAHSRIDAIAIAGCHVCKQHNGILGICVTCSTAYCGNHPCRCAPRQPHDRSP